MKKLALILLVGIATLFTACSHEDILAFLDREEPVSMDEKDVEGV